MENIEPAEPVNVYDGQLKCCDQQCTELGPRIHRRVLLKYDYLWFVSEILAVLYSEEAEGMRSFGIIFAHARS